MAADHNRPGKAAAIVELLRDGPATTAEVADSLGMPAKLAATHLANLHRRGRVTRTPWNPSTDTMGRTRRWLWAAVEGR